MCWPWRHWSEHPRPRFERLTRNRVADFHLLPGSTPHRETVLESGDLIPTSFFRRHRRKQAGLSQATRSRVLRIRAGIRQHVVLTDQQRQDHAGPYRARRSGYKTVLGLAGLATSALRRRRSGHDRCCRRSATSAFGESASRTVFVPHSAERDTGPRDLAAAT